MWMSSAVRLHPHGYFKCYRIAQGTCRCSWSTRNWKRSQFLSLNITWVSSLRNKHRDHASTQLPKQQLGSCDYPSSSNKHLDHASTQLPKQQLPPPLSESTPASSWSAFMSCISICYPVDSCAHAESIPSRKAVQWMRCMKFIP